LEIDMGCGSKPSAATPTAPTTQSSTQDWINALPQIYQAQMQYAPLIAQQQQQIQEQLYPKTSALQENLAGQATEGMNSDVPAWMKQQYQSDMNAQLGPNAASGIGADYASRGLMQQQQNWKQYYQNMGLSLAGRQPLVQPGLDYMSSFGPGGVMQSNNQNYGTQANIYGTQANFETQQNQAMMKLIGAGIGAVGSAVGGSASGGQSAAAVGGG